jgi:hypothetical protein
VHQQRFKQNQVFAEKPNPTLIRHQVEAIMPKGESVRKHPAGGHEESVWESVDEKKAGRWICVRNRAPPKSKE